MDTFDKATRAFSNLRLVAKTESEILSMEVNLLTPEQREAYEIALRNIWNAYAPLKTVSLPSIVSETLGISIGYAALANIK